jgi:hypothetical protein
MPRHYKAFYRNARSEGEYFRPCFLTGTWVTLFCSDREWALAQPWLEFIMRAMFEKARRG